MTLKAELLFAARHETGESPVWDGHAQRLWWTDIPGRRLHRIDPETVEGGREVVRVLHRRMNVEAHLRNSPLQ